MGKEEWGKHVRRHFEEEGYWMCTGTGTGTGTGARVVMASRFA
jgi:hypothetical protein